MYLMFYAIVMFIAHCVMVGERRKGLQKHYTTVRKDVENLLQQLKDLEKSNFRLIQTNETLKAQMELQVVVHNQ